MISVTYRTLIAIVIITGVVSSLTSCSWRKDTEEIVANLQKDTPIGSTEQEVIAHRDEVDITHDDLWRGRVDPDVGYPPNAVLGRSFIRALVGEYGIFFVTSVESFYIFGDDGRLVEVVVRKTEDSL